MISFNSFDSFFQNAKKRGDINENHQKYHAHTHPKKRSETLEEHIELVNFYSKKLTVIHGLEKVIDSLILEVVEKSDCIKNKVVFGNYIKQLFTETIIFHDYGKVNPNFQIKKMKNTLFEWDNSIKIDSQHSKLSAYVFINFHLKNIVSSKNSFSKEEQATLVGFVILFSNPILRHHAPFLDHRVEFSNDERESIQRFLKEFEVEFEKLVCHTTLDNQERVLDNFRTFLDLKNYFPIFALLKLNFSLLTASDFYATSEYMNGFAIKDFGIIDDVLRRKIICNFRNFDYNKLLFNKKSTYKNLGFENLETRSRMNLNFLRSKLADEVIQNAKDNSDECLFYLEAPTGGGKTNLSLGIATELLEANPELNKIFYVFPFTTLITQSFDAIKECIDLKSSEMIQLHSKSGFHSKAENDEDVDGVYGDLKENYLSNLFINYPITLLSHIKFFNILKSNSKDNNYILHRLANSIVIIDELQSYNPKHWDKVLFYLANYAKHFNIRFVLMSATLPKIDEILEEWKESFVRLLSKESRNKYFQNINFRGRVEFDFTLLDDTENWKIPKTDEDRSDYLTKMQAFVHEKSEKYATKNSNRTRTIIEFIKKKSASEFRTMVEKEGLFAEYQIYLISGEILSPRRKQIIDEIKTEKYQKILLISTQVVEAGVDIDMDLGFKDKSLIDSDEQLAGRVNRNASKEDCKVYIFNFDREIVIYGNDDRYKVTRKSIPKERYKSILREKAFDDLYGLVNEKIIKKNLNPHEVNLDTYKDFFKNFLFKKVHQEFKLIEESNDSVFVPLPIPKAHFDKDDWKILEAFEIPENEKGEIEGKTVWRKYVELNSITFEEKKKRYIESEVEMKQIYGVLSKFMFSVFPKQLEDLKPFSDGTCEGSYYDRFGILYLLNWKDYKGVQVYFYENGIDDIAIKSDNFL